METSSQIQLRVSAVLEFVTAHPLPSNHQNEDLTDPKADPRRKKGLPTV
jgi:hypothetical protein